MKIEKNFHRNYTRLEREKGGNIWKHMECQIIKY